MSYILEHYTIQYKTTQHLSSSQVGRINTVTTKPPPLLINLTYSTILLSYLLLLNLPQPALPSFTWAHRGSYNTSFLSIYYSYLFYVLKFTLTQHTVYLHQPTFYILNVRSHTFYVHVYFHNAWRFFLFSEKMSANFQRIEICHASLLFRNPHHTASQSAHSYTSHKVYPVRNTHCDH